MRLHPNVLVLGEGAAAAGPPGLGAGAPVVDARPVLVVRVAVYLRVSTEQQDEAAQEHDTLQLCRARGWEPVVYRERVSGARLDRVQWMAVRQAARKGEVRRVVVWALDRLGRGDMFSIIDEVRELARVCCPVVSVREPEIDLESELGPVLLSVFAWVAGWERRRNVARTKAGIRVAKASGVHCGRPARLTPPMGLLALQQRAAGRSWLQVAQSLGVKRETLRSGLRRLVQRGALPGPPAAVEIAGKLAM